MNRLRTIILLLGFTLITVVARMIIDGPSLLAALTAVAIVALLLGASLLRRQGLRLLPDAGPETDRRRTSHTRQR